MLHLFGNFIKNFIPVNINKAKNVVKMFFYVRGKSIPQVLFHRALSCIVSQENVHFWCMKHGCLGRQFFFLSFLLPCIPIKANISSHFPLSLVINFLENLQSKRFSCYFFLFITWMASYFSSFAVFYFFIFFNLVLLVEEMERFFFSFSFCFAYHQP